MFHCIIMKIPKNRLIIALAIAVTSAGLLSSCDSGKKEKEEQAKKDAEKKKEEEKQAQQAEEQEVVGLEGTGQIAAYRTPQRA